MRYLLGLLVVLGIVGTCGQAQAGLLNLAETTPDIYTSFTTINYNYGSSLFTASGSAWTLTTTGGIEYDVLGANTAYTITATIDHSGNATLGLPSLVINGEVGEVGATSGTLLTGTLAKFGYMDPPGGGQFDFVFNVTGGDLASSFGPQVGAILIGASTTFTGVFSDPAGFHNSTQDGAVDTFPVPEPATLALLATGGFLALGRRIRRTRQSATL
jgi:hypothetical protein